MSQFSPLCCTMSPDELDNAAPRSACLVVNQGQEPSAHERMQMLDRGRGPPNPRLVGQPPPAPPSFCKQYGGPLVVLAMVASLAMLGVTVVMRPRVGQPALQERRAQLVSTESHAREHGSEFEVAKANVVPEAPAALAPIAPSAARSGAPAAPLAYPSAPVAPPQAATYANEPPTPPAASEVATAATAAELPFVAQDVAPVTVAAPIPPCTTTLAPALGAEKVLPMSCAAFGCSEELRPEQYCQCDSKCQSRQNCCPDMYQVCMMPLAAGAASGGPAHASAGAVAATGATTTAVPATAAPATAAPTTAAPLPEPFNCTLDVEHWESRWAFKKQSWCCAHKQLGCSQAHTVAASAGETHEVVTVGPVPQPPPGVKVDCTLHAGEDWQRSWSEPKKRFCCDSMGVGCEVPKDAAPYRISGGSVRQLRGLQ